MSLPWPIKKATPVPEGNTPVRCTRCHKRLADLLPDGRLDIRWQTLKVVAHAPATIHCPRCQEPNEIEK